jgi:hypothetical protein
MPAPDGRRYYNECPYCGSVASLRFKSALPMTGKQWSPEDPLPEYREDCECANCGKSWMQTRKGAIGEIIETN